MDTGPDVENLPVHLNVRKKLLTKFGKKAEAENQENYGGI